MLRSEALLVDHKRAAHQGLGLGRPVGGPQQMGEPADRCGISRIFLATLSLGQINEAVGNCNRFFVLAGLVQLRHLLFQSV